MKKTVWRKIFALVLAGALTVGLFVWRQGGEQTVFSPVRMPQLTLVIDAGHGGEDGGAVSGSGVIESHINLAIALRVKGLMDFCGVRSFLLRETDISLHDSGAETLRQKKVSDLHNRVAAIESTENALLLSIHQNTFTSAKYHGAQVFFGLHPDSLPLAQAVQEAIRTSLDPENSRVPTKIPSSVYLMNHITCPAILVECGFLSNPEEELLLQTPEYQTKLATVLTAGLLAYQQTTEGESLHEE